MVGSLLSALALALCAVSATADLLLDRQGTASLSDLTCGRTSYTKTEVDAAVAEGCRLYAAGDQVGSGKYPHRYNNFEGLVFAASGPYQEFPILQSGSVYTGRSPGPDRVVFNPNYQGSCVYVGAITHTGASGNGFVPCLETSAGGATASSSTNRPTASSSRSSTATPTRSGATSTSTSTASAGTNAAAPGLSGGSQGAVVGAVVGLLLL
ncbi:Ribonuclease/ribotoxin [Parathielavia hyrcaniae]|uniref:ribonuclease T1 n=1 Tax=Parathielavia hyrcaniae TaxID=113614 RepID=A0AAN6PRQ3_9PEZI|nr:Ribonuclease/ribotoxin [Parathielavia hyrcaniae]